MIKENFQLTPYRPGSVKEMWALSWPLMLSLLSGCLMNFFDRLFLGNYSLQALTAATVSWMAAYVLLMTPMTAAAISKVFVGKLHGANAAPSIGKPVWQMLWFSLFMLPVFWLLAALLPPLFFANSASGALQTTYFSLLIRGGTWFCFVAALSGFFTGQGKTKFVGVVTLGANGVNIILDLILIFGWGPFPSLGVKGAAMATVMAQASEALFLGFFFVKQAKKLGPLEWQLDIKAVLSYLKTGIFAGIAYTSEMLAHFVFFKILEKNDPIYLTIVTFINSIYILLTFVIEGMCKSVMTLAANFIGAKRGDLLTKNLFSAFKLHALFFGILFSVLVVGGASLFKVFVQGSDAHIFDDLHFATLLKYTSLGIALYFLIDGINWMTIGSLIATEDTRFIMFAALMAQWGGYVLPVYLAVNWLHLPMPLAWVLVLISNLVLLPVLLMRFKYKAAHTHLLVE